MSKIPEQIKKLVCAAISWYIFLHIKGISPAFAEVYVCNCAYNNFPVVVTLIQIIPIHILPRFFRKYFNIALEFYACILCLSPMKINVASVIFLLVT
jgi:hypothetical protein